MADRQVVPSNTFEQFRVEFNELAGDVGDVALLPSSINGQTVNDVIGGIKQLNDGLANVLFPNVIDLPDSTNASTGRVKFGADDDFQLFHDGTNSKINNSTGELQVNADRYGMGRSYMPHLASLYCSLNLAKLTYCHFLLDQGNNYLKSRKIKLNLPMIPGSYVFNIPEAIRGCNEEKKNVGHSKK